MFVESMSMCYSSVYSMCPWNFRTYSFASSDRLWNRFNPYHITCSVVNNLGWMFSLSAKVKLSAILPLHHSFSGSWKCQIYKHNTQTDWSTKRMILQPKTRSGTSIFFRKNSTWNEQMIFCFMRHQSHRFYAHKWSQLEKSINNETISL